MTLLIVIAFRNLYVPMWVSYVLPEAILLIPGFVYVKVNHINIRESLPIKNTKVSQLVLSIVVGYMLVPLANLISLLTMNFSTNHVTDSVGTLYNDPFIVNLLIIAVVPAVVE